MDISKSTMQGLGALALVGVLAGAGFLVVKPQVASAFELQNSTQEVEENTQLRELRLIKLQKADEDLPALKALVDAQLELMPSRRDAHTIQASVVKALEDIGLSSTTLSAYSYGALDPAQPAFQAPKLSLTGPEAPFELTDPALELVPAEAAPVAEGEEAPAEGAEPAAEAFAADPGATDMSLGPNAPAPAMAGVPFSITVNINSPEELMRFADQLQSGDRLITIASIVTTDSGATIYAYAFAGSDPLVEQWESEEDAK
jgi:Tfp pilus assembly protein PilO